MRRRTIFILVRVFVSLILLGLLFFLMKDKLADLIRIIQEVDFPLFFFALLFIGLIILVSSLRLQRFLAVQSLSFKLYEITRLVLIGYFFNNFMVSTVGGDVAKIYYAKKRSGDYTRPFSAVFMDRITGLSGLIILSAAAVIIWGSLIRNAAAKLIILVSFVSLLSVLILINSGAAGKKINCLFNLSFLSRIKERIFKIYKAVELYRQSKSLVYGLGLSLASHIFLACYAFVLSKSLNVEIPVSVFLVLVPVVSLISCLPSLNGLGIREGAFVYFFKDFIVPEKALALSILYFAQMLLVSAIGGFVYLLSGAEIIKEVADD